MPSIQTFSPSEFRFYLKMIPFSFGSNYTSHNSDSKSHNSDVLPQNSASIPFNSLSPLKISDSKSHNSNFPYNSDFISCNSVFCPQNRFYFTSLILNLTIQTFPLRIPILYLRIPIFPQNSDFIFHNSDSISCNSDVLIFRFYISQFWQA